MEPPNANLDDGLTDSVVTLTYDREGNQILSPPKRYRISITADLARAFARAAAVNKNDSTPLSFTSLLIAMITGTDATSELVKQLLERQRVTAEKISHWRTRPLDLNLMASRQSPAVELATSISARRVIEEAQKIAFTLETGSAVDLRHLAAAYPILPSWHEKDFEDLGIDRLAWCRELGGRMAQTFEKEKWYWSDYADRASPVPLTSFSADVYTDKDLLGIDRTVDALALLIASTRTDTPLSIGVFGPWGSGKSFFMRHLRQRIWNMAEREQNRVAGWIARREAGTATPEDAPLYYGQVAQVEFNAWHYNEGNLVASLVDHLFRNLRVLPGPKDKDLEERRASVLLQISGAEVEVKEAGKVIEQQKDKVDNARAEVTRAESAAVTVREQIDAKARELEESTRQAEQAQSTIDGTLQALATEAAGPDPQSVLGVALDPLINAPVVGEIGKKVEEFLTEIAGWKNFVTRLYSPRGVAVIALCLAVPLVTWLTEWLTAQWAALAGVVTTGIAAMTHVIDFIRERRRQFERKFKELEEEENKRREQRRKELLAEATKVQAAWKKKLDTLQRTIQQQRDVLAEREVAVKTAARQLAEKTKDLDQKVQQRTTAEAKLREAEAQLKRLSSALLLDEFIKERSSTDEYRKQLSFLALVRRDFERLSDLIAAANNEWCDPKKKAPPPLLNRIVLYIDDLDRCKVETVMSVLEAVHLLLAFPLFVCVVAVDPRWIEECLRSRHPQLFGPLKHDSDPAATADRQGSGTGNGSLQAHVTVGDYLEKIFQIPIWMRPISATQRAAMVKSLLGTTAAPEPRGTTSERPSLEEAPPPPPLRERTPVGASMSDGFEELVVEAKERPDPLRITRQEALFVNRIGPLLSDKPRALKRFVNTYRLLKASLPDIDRQTFVSDDPFSPYKICMNQLALFTGQPRLAAALVKQLAREGDASLSNWRDGLLPEEKRLIEAALMTANKGAELPLVDFRAWLPDTTKYLFHRDD